VSKEYANHNVYYDPYKSIIQSSDRLAVFVKCIITFSTVRKKQVIG